MEQQGQYITRSQLKRILLDLFCLIIFREVSRDSGLQKHTTFNVLYMYLLKLLYNIKNIFKLIKP